jgi:RelA/SpoT family (p)ppGpp synthetase
MADRLHNMKTLGSLKPDKRRRKAQETLEIYAPIAHRLGMNTFKNAFEDLGFQILYPMRYRILKACVDKARGNRKRLLEKIDKKLQDSLREAGIEQAKIWGREKRLYSIFKKMRYKRLPFSEIMDVYGFRIIVKDKAACYLTLGAVHNLFIPVPGRFKDYIAIPKANGYQSLHTTLFGPYGVPIEIQIRSEEMERTARNGIAAHWLYKDKGYISTTENQTRMWLQQVLDMQMHSGNSLEFIENMKVDLYPDEVYVFTPSGEIMAMPKGATAIDFAYTVHTELGNHCLGVKINRRMAPLSQVLQSGQTIEIITSPDAKPNPSWLNMVMTGKAKGAIRHYLNNQQHEEALDLGNRLLTYSLMELGIDLKKVPQKKIKLLLEALQCDRMDNLYTSIGLGERASAVVAHQVSELLEGHVDHLTEYKPCEKVCLSITGSEGMSVLYPACCAAIPGDDVRGVVKKGKGVEVHRVECAALLDLDCEKYPESVVGIAWSEHITGYYRAKLRIEIRNTRGSIASIASAISQEEGDIQQFHVDEVENTYGILSIGLDVKSRVHLARILRRLRNLPSVMKVMRVPPRRKKTLL